MILFHIPIFYKNHNSFKKNNNSQHVGKKMTYKRCHDFEIRWTEKLFLRQ